MLCRSDQLTFRVSVRQLLDGFQRLPHQLLLHGLQRVMRLQRFSAHTEGQRVAVHYALQEVEVAAQKAPHMNAVTMVDHGSVDSWQMALHIEGCPASALHW